MPNVYIKVSNSLLLKEERLVTLLKIELGLFHQLKLNHVVVFCLLLGLSIGWYACSQVISSSNYLDVIFHQNLFHTDCFESNEFLFKGIRKNAARKYG